MSYDTGYDGTTAQDGGDDSADALLAGTPDAADVNAEGQDEVAALQRELESLRGFKQQALAEKQSLESLRREVADLRAGQSAPASPMGTYGAPNPYAAQATALEARLAELKAAAAAGNPDAALLVGMFDYAGQLQSQLSEMRELSTVPVDQQEQVKQVQWAAAQRGERISAATARRMLELERAAGQAGALQSKEQELAAAEQARARGVVRTVTTGVPAAEAGPRTMTFDEWSAAYDRATPQQKLELNRRTSFTPDGKARIRPA